ncbi:hypothetical protein EVAR_72184_1 [Eumeta japonica]|uniref:Uncharacterized protein n=1 Tax=Eumeta variegata TaxID=151549 RepID=A0A4C1T5B6_EUMVA|nr:hypothetical protein EVAR_72184_1 [Eumeta japonica]
MRDDRPEEPERFDVEQGVHVPDQRVVVPQIARIAWRPMGPQILLGRIESQFIVRQRTNFSRSRRRPFECDRDIEVALCRSGVRRRCRDLDPEVRVSFVELGEVREQHIGPEPVGSDDAEGTRDSPLRSRDPRWPPSSQSRWSQRAEQDVDPPL